MRKSDRYTFLFALVVCVSCSLLLAVTATALRQRQEQNVELDRKLNILRALGESDNLAGPEDIQRIFDGHIFAVLFDAETGELSEQQENTLPLYLWKDGTEVTKYAFPISGKGLWSTIYGYLAIEQDMDTILGITFYRHGETPGLGGEIEKPWFCEQFRGKKLTKDGKLTNFTVMKGKVSDFYPDGSAHAVDGISGATMTCKGLNKFINESLVAYDVFFAKQRKAKQ